MLNCVLVAIENTFANRNQIINLYVYIFIWIYIYIYYILLMYLFTIQIILLFQDNKCVEHWVTKKQLIITLIFKLAIISIFLK